MIDTASNYDTAEKDLGKIGVNKLDIVTKLPKLKKKLKSRGKYYQRLTCL